MSPNLTPARRAALAALCTAHQQGRSAVIARSTSTEPARVTLSSAGAAWLIDHGYARTTTGLPGCKFVVATEAGLALAARERDP